MDSLKKDCNQFEQIYLKNKNAKICDWTPVSGKVLGQGTKGYVIKVCCNNSCDYMVKIQKASKNNNELIRKEINVHDTAIKLDVAPLLYDAFKCNSGNVDTWYIVMEPFDIDLDKYSKELKYNFSLSREEKVNIFESFRKSFKEMYKTLLLNNIVHTDLTGENMMFKKVLINGEETTKLAIIDYGITENRTLSKQELNSFLHGLDMTFDLLIKQSTSISNSDVKPMKSPPQIKKRKPVHVRNEEYVPFVSPSSNVLRFEEIPETPTTPFKKLSFGQFDNETPIKMKGLNFGKIDDESPIKIKGLNFD